MSDLKKVSMNLNRKSLENIEEISKIIGEKNKTRVVSSALQITVEIFNIAKENKVILRDKNGNDQELFFII